MVTLYSESKQTFTSCKQKVFDQRDSTEIKVFTLHVPDLGSIPSTTNGPLSSCQELALSTVGCSPSNEKNEIVYSKNKRIMLPNFLMTKS